MRTVFLAGIDVSRFISDIPPIIQQTAEVGQLLINDIPSITGINITGFWDATNSISPLFGVPDIQTIPITIIQDGETTFDGKIHSISISNQSRDVTINLLSALQAAVNQKIVFVSGASETPAAAVKKLLSLYKIPIDSASFARSENIYQTDNVFISASWARPEVTLLDALQQFANVGVARIFALNGIVYFEVFEAKDTESIFTFSDKSDNVNGVTILEAPTVEPLQKEPALGYSIQWIGIPTALAGAEQQRTINITGGTDTNLRILSLQAAVFIGRRWQLYLQTVQNQITFKTRNNLGKSLGLRFPVIVEYKENQTQLIDITAIDTSELVSATITGVTR